MGVRQRTTKHYCEMNVNCSIKILAATAIGTKVKFWKYEELNLTPQHSGVLDLLEASGRNETEFWLEAVRAEGWNRTTSG